MLFHEAIMTLAYSDERNKGSREGKRRKRKGREGQRERERRWEKRDSSSERVIFNLKIHLVYALRALKMKIISLSNSSLGIYFL